MNYFHALIFGIVEGISEFLPISSTGHLILTAKLLGLDHTQFLKTFEISIQLGAILSVVVLYWRQILVNFEIMKRVAAAFIPTAIIGFILYKFIKKFLLGNESVVLWSLFLGGIFLIVFEFFHKEKEEAHEELETISFRKAILIGLAQSLAVIPGVSRSAATICGGLALGLKRKTIVEFSFLLAIPTMLAATALDLAKNASSFSMDQFSVLGIGFLVSFIVAWLSVKFLLHFIKRHNFIYFGVYRILLALLFWIL
jgi:undecaprenyl-diphosphatase